MAGQGEQVVAKLGEQVQNAATMIGGLAEVMGQFSPEAGQDMAKALELIQSAMSKVGGGAPQQGAPQPQNMQSPDAAGTNAQPENIGR